MILKIDNWGMVATNDNDGYTPPEALRFSLTGDVNDHPKLGCVKGMTTSTIIGKKSGRVVTYSGSEYELGTTSEEYEKLFPNAKERLLKSLKEV